MKFGLGIDGTAELGNTLDKLTKQFKQAESAMKANMKAFDGAGNSVNALEQKYSDLTSVVKIQEKRIDVLNNRRTEAIKKYGEESKQVQTLNTQINNSTSKYNALSTELNKTKQAYVIASSGVDEYSKAMKDNERNMKAEVSALKSAGDKVGAYKAQKEGLKRQDELTTKAIQAQEKAIEGLSSEFGENSREVQTAKDRLGDFKRQQQLTAKQLDGTEKQLKETSNATENMNEQLKKTDSAGDKASKGLSKISGATKGALSGIKTLVGSVGFGAMATVGNKAIGAISSNLDSAISRIDTLANSTRAFENMGFSAKATSKAMDGISKAIEGLPTALNDSVSNVQLLAASTGDLDKSVDVYKALNDGILGFGGDANMATNAIVQLSQAFSNGKVDASTWNSMINSGLGPSLNAMAKTMGKTTGELKEGLSNGSISVEQFQNALIKLDKEGGGGLKALGQIAKDSTKGISTSIANAKTAMVRGTAELIKGFDTSLQAMNLPSIGEMISNSGKRVEGFMKAVATAMPAVASKLTFVGDTFNAVFGGIKSTLDNAKNWIEAFGVMWKGDGIIDPKKLGLDLDTVMAIDESVVNLKKSVGGLFTWFDSIKSMWTGDGIVNLNELGLDLDTVFLIDDSIQSIKKTFTSFKEYLVSSFTLGDNEGPAGFIQKLADGLNYFTKTILPMVIPFIAKALETIVKLITGVRKIIVQVMDYVIKNIVPLLMPILQKLFDAFGKIFDKISSWWDNNGDRIGKAILNLVKLLQPVFKIAIVLLGSFIDSVIGFFDGMVDFITGTIDVFSMVLTGDFKGLWDAIKRIFLGGIKAVWNYINIIFVKNIVTAVKGLGTNFTNIIKGLWGSIKNLFSSGTTGAWNMIKGWASNIANGVRGIKNNFTQVIKDLWTGVKNTFKGGMDTVVGWIKGLPKKLADGIKGGAHFLKDAFKNMFNGAMKVIEKPVNGIIGGANWILEKLGMDKMKTWEAPKYAQGTPNGGHPGGPMTVNDGRGAEMVIDPSGQAIIPKGKNVTMYGRRGTQVLTAEETAQVLGHKRPKFAYKKGTGFFDKVTGGVKNLWTGAKNMAKSAFDKVGSFVGDIWDYASNPSKLVEKVFSSVVDTSGLIKYPLDIATGLVKKATTAMTSKVADLFSSGNLDTGVGTAGVYKYLADVARKVVSKFPGMRVTSGYRPGDPYSHGSRNAIDVAFPASMNGSSKYREAGNYAFDNFKNQVGYVIALNKVRDRAGTSGTGIHDAWTNWASGGHMDHLHINGVRDPQSKGGAIDTTTTGSGVDRWRATAKRALQMTGQWTTANLNALMNQMRTESNGNPKAINLWDINAKNGIPSKGLMQVIDPTFRQYAMKPYNKNIYDPLSNILASIRYTLSRYGSLTKGWRGVGYANGGLITREHLAMVGEGNKPEMVIPLDSAKRSRAMMLLAEAQKRLGVTPTTVVAGGSNDELIAQLIIQQQQTNILLQALLEKDTDVYLDKRKVTAEIEPVLTKGKEKATMTAGRRLGRLV